LVTVGNEEINALGLYDPPQDVGERGMSHGRSQIVSIRRRFLEKESVGVAADNEEGRVPCPQAPD
jgi:hypothetical protein